MFPTRNPLTVYQAAVRTASAVSYRIATVENFSISARNPNSSMPPNHG